MIFGLSIPVIKYPKLRACELMEAGNIQTEIDYTF